MARIELESPIPVLLRELKEQYSDQKEDAWTAAGKMGQSSILALTAGLEEQENLVRLNSCLALSALARTPGASQLDWSSVTVALEKAALDPDLAVQNAAADALRLLRNFPAGG